MRDGWTRCRIQDPLWGRIGPLKGWGMPAGAGQRRFRAPHRASTAAALLSSALMPVDCAVLASKIS
ncbi:hypothetical protein BH05_14780 [Thermobifida fusca]|nr:hypothetical protein BH05_14780 [Thermobifida fusca]